MQTGDASPVCIVQRRKRPFRSDKGNEKSLRFSLDKTDKSFHVLLNNKPEEISLFNQSLLYFSVIGRINYLIFICTYVKNIRYLQSVLTITW